MARKPSMLRLAAADQLADTAEPATKRYFSQGRRTSGQSQGACQAL